MLETGLECVTAFDGWLVVILVVDMFGEMRCEMKCRREYQDMC